jgi:hypothetical protein
MDACAPWTGDRLSKPSFGSNLIRFGNSPRRPSGGTGNTRGERSDLDKATELWRFLRKYPGMKDAPNSVAYDPAGNVGRSANVTVTVKN